MGTYRFVWMLIGSEIAYGDALSILYEVHVKGNHSDGDKYLLKKSYQGIFRCRAGVGGQGSHEAMESPQALMCPLEKGVGGIEISGLWGQGENPVFRITKKYVPLNR